MQSLPQRKQHFSITRLNWFMLFKEISLFILRIIKKVKLSRYMPWRHMGGGGERRYGSYSYLTSALDGG
jgi:hypothetical protein